MKCPMIVLTRTEMRTGIDKVTGERRRDHAGRALQRILCRRHRKPGELVWPDIILFTKKYYTVPAFGASGWANVGAGKMWTSNLPPITVYVGGHGAPSTQAALLALHGPGIPQGVSLPAPRPGPSDVAPTLYALEGYDPRRA